MGRGDNRRTSKMIRKKSQRAKKARAKKTVAAVKSSRKK
jgi:hypothetical protein